MKRSATAVAGLACLALVLLSAGPATADVRGRIGAAGAKTTRDTQPGVQRASHGRDVKTGSVDQRHFEYTSATTCPFSHPGGANADIMCAGAIQACAGNTPAQGLGPQVRLYRREVDVLGHGISGWISLGTTCSPELAPGKKVLSIAPVLAAFHNTPFAKPTVHIQPEGNVTLVTLKTFFEVKWPAAGFEPGEVDTTTLLGFQVRIRPTAESYTYVFGDGTSEGPTDSAGGIYPDGDVTHTYAKAGTYNTRIDITYGGEFSLDGGVTWIQIGETAPVTGTVQPLIVKTAHARLVAN